MSFTTLGTGVWDPLIKAKTHQHPGLIWYIYISHHFTYLPSIYCTGIQFTVLLRLLGESLAESPRASSSDFSCDDLSRHDAFGTSCRRPPEGTHCWLRHSDTLCLILIACCGLGGLSFRWRQQHGWRRATGRWISFHPHAKLIQDSRDSLDELHGIITIIADCDRSGCFQIHEKPWRLSGRLVSSPFLPHHMPGAFTIRIGS